MTDYMLTLVVKVYDIDEDDYYFHEDTMDYLLETGLIENADIESITEF